MSQRMTVILCSILFCLTCSTQTFAFQNNVTLKQKIAQMILIGFKGTELHDGDAISQAILNQKVGGVILFDYDYQTKTFDHNIKNPEQLKALTKQLQDYTTNAAKTHRNSLYPLLVSVDYEGGSVNRLNERYGFPKTLSAAEIGQGSLEQAKKYADQMAETLQQEGINVNFAPVLDVNVNPDNPVIGKLGRSFSSDPQKVIQYAAIFSKAYAEHGILCSYKHFPGHGSSTADSHLGFVDVTQTWKPYELDPYKELLQQPYGCPMVMTAHVVNYNLDSNGYPASISHAMTTDLLRDKLHFNGVVVTDDLQMKAIADNYGLDEAVRLAVNAGADILVFGNQLVTVPQDPQQIIDMIYHDVVTGKISERRIDDAYQHIMALKQRLRVSVTD